MGGVDDVDAAIMLYIKSNPNMSEEDSSLTSFTFSQNAIYIIAQQFVNFVY